MARPGINGIGVATIVTGLIVLWSGLKNATVLDTLRALTRGEPIPSAGSDLAAARSQVATTPGVINLGSSVNGAGSTTGAAIAADAQRYIGVPYVWAAATPDGWDCSGFVTYVLHHDFGLNLPDNNHTLTYGFYVWSGAITVARDQCQPGDLVCWWSHIGIATSKDTMVNAPGIGIPTREQEIGPGPIIRRPLAYGAAPVINGGKKASR